MELTIEQMKARIAELESTVAKKNAATGDIHIGKKGGVSFKIPGSWPVTLKAENWKLVLSNSARILAFIEKNQALLTATPAVETPAATV
jgi:hypothetical protein